MLIFQSPHNLYWLLFIPLCCIIYIYQTIRQRKKMAVLGNRDRIMALMPGRSKWRKHIRFGLPMLANDVQPSRLDRAKLLVTNMVDKMKNDKVALGVFAGEAYPQLPITSDYAAAKTFIDALSAGMVTMQGTDIAAAIDLGCKSFTQNKDVGKAIILITDGENHEGGAEEAAKAAAKAGINVYVIGVGTTQGSEIPTANGPLTDANGQVVHTALNEQMCRDIAQAGKGLYLHLDQSNSAQDELQTQLKQLKQSSTTTSYTARNEQFQAVALIALLLLIIEACINDTKNAFFNKFKIFNK